MNNFCRFAVGIPEIRVADVGFNVKSIIGIIQQAAEKNVQALLFPELCLTGGTCGDLFYQEDLICSVSKALSNIADACKGFDALVVIGAPIKASDGYLYNCAVNIVNGKIVGMKYKSKLSLAEKRWFCDGSFDNCEKFFYHNEKFIPLMDNFIYRFHSEHNKMLFKAGVVFGDDYKQPFCDAESLSLMGANIILNMACLSETAGGINERRNLISSISNRCGTGYLFANSGFGESSTDFIFGGQGLICENGEILSETKSFKMESQMIFYDLDIDLIDAERIRRRHCCDIVADVPFFEYKIKANTPKKLARHISQNPFLPESSIGRDEFCSQVLDMLCVGTIKRFKHTNSQKLVVGVSGGLDSTMALLVSYYSKKRIGESLSDVIAITMPGYGTSSKTYNNAVKLIKLLGATFKEIPIRDACDVHLKDIGHDKRHDAAFENSQARERTQILMDIANMENGIVIGTGDFTELALGFATYNGDHMSNYCVNGNLPKTVIREIIRWIGNREDMPNEAKEIFDSIINTPISPELLPTDEAGEIKQRTEDIVGSYELNDFILYYALKYGFSREKIAFMISHAFAGKYSEVQISSGLDNFYRRFITQQFKRSCMPDGPAVYDFGFSPRGGFMAPSDAGYSVWVNK